MEYKVIADCVLCKKQRKQGEIVNISEISNDTFFDFYVANGSLVPVEQDLATEKPIEVVDDKEADTNIDDTVVLQEQVEIEKPVKKAKK
jgi:hypothetical protein